MQCYSDSYEECKETQHITNCGKYVDSCYSLTYSSKNVVHGSEAINQGVKKGCTSECNECNFYRFANKKCEVSLLTWKLKRNKEKNTIFDITTKIVPTISIFSYKYMVKPISCERNWMFNRYT